MAEQAEQLGVVVAGFIHAVSGQAVSVSQKRGAADVFEAAVDFVA